MIPKRSMMLCALAASSLAIAACTPAAVAADAVNLDSAISKTAADVAAWRANPGSATLIAAVAEDAAVLQADIVQLRVDLGGAAPPAKVAQALDDAQRLAQSLSVPDVAQADHLSAEANAVRGEAAGIAEGL